MKSEAFVSVFHARICNPHSVASPVAGTHTHTHTHTHHTCVCVCVCVCVSRGKQRWRHNMLHQHAVESCVKPPLLVPRNICTVTIQAVGASTQVLFLIIRQTLSVCKCVCVSVCVCRNPGVTSNSNSNGTLRVALARTSIQPN